MESCCSYIISHYCGSGNVITTVQSKRRPSTDTSCARQYILMTEEKHFEPKISYRMATESCVYSFSSSMLVFRSGLLSIQDFVFYNGKENFFITCTCLFRVEKAPLVYLFMKQTIFPVEQQVSIPLPSRLTFIITPEITSSMRLKTEFCKTSGF